MYRESERLLADPAVERGDRVIAEGMVGRYEGLHFENKWAERLHQTGMKVPRLSVIHDAITSKLEHIASVFRPRSETNAVASQALKRGHVCAIVAARSYKPPCRPNRSADDPNGSLRDDDCRWRMAY